MRKTPYMIKVVSQVAKMWEGKPRKKDGAVRMEGMLENQVWSKRMTGKQLTEKNADFLLRNCFKKLSNSFQVHYN